MGLVLTQHHEKLETIKDPQDICFMVNIYFHMPSISICLIISNCTDL